MKKLKEFFKKLFGGNYKCDLCKDKKKFYSVMAGGVIRCPRCASGRIPNIKTGL